MMDPFDEVISSRDRLREIMGMPNHRVASKVVDHIDDICRRFIAASPFAVIATRGNDGRLDQSPKGDPAGFVTVLDEKTLAVRIAWVTTGSTRSRTSLSTRRWG